MKKVLRVLGYAVLIILILVIGAMTYIKTMLPNVGDAPDIKVEKTAMQLERGEYLANHVMLCMDCHSTRDWSLFSGPMVEGTQGKGGEIFDQNLGFPGKYIAPNIRPYGLKDWTDGELLRAITTGVTRDGRALFSIMPHHNFGLLNETDIQAVIAYIRSLNSIENVPEVSSSDFPMNFIINTIPKKANLTKIPSKTDLINYGKYMITASGCSDCHTKQVQGKVVGQPYAGGFDFKLLDGSVVTSSNITPDKTTGIGSWNSDQFVNRFKVFQDSSYVNPKVPSGEFQTIMPWTMYAGMDTVDIQAIFAYLQTLEPVSNMIEKFTAAK